MQIRFLSSGPCHMTATTPICDNPSSKFLGRNLLKQRQLKNTSFADSFSASRLVICGGFVLREVILSRNNIWVPNTMDRWIRTSAFRDGNIDENVQVFEQEAFIDGSSEFRPKFSFQQVESFLNRLSKWIIAALLSTLILWRHDAEALWFVGGSVLNVKLSASLKHILNQERPSTLKSDPGMPSSHAQSIFFTVMFIILSCVEWAGTNKVTIASSGLALILGSYFSYLRVSQKLHTLSQVAVGAVIGSFFCVLWYWLWNAFMLDAFMSSLWVRIIVVLGSVGLVGFLLC